MARPTPTDDQLNEWSKLVARVRALTGMTQQQFAEIVLSQNESICLWERGFRMGDKWSRAMIELLDFLLAEDPYPSPYQRRIGGKIQRYQWPHLHKAILAVMARPPRGGSKELAIMELLCTLRNDWFTAKMENGSIPPEEGNLIPLSRAR